MGLHTKQRLLCGVLQARKCNFERGETQKNDILGIKMIIFGHFSRFLASFKISFSSLQHPTYNTLKLSDLHNITSILQFSPKTYNDYIISRGFCNFILSLSLQPISRIEE